MRRIAWPGLMRLGVVRLGLTPEVFWGLTPVELMLMAGQAVEAGSMTRSGLAALALRFPDKPRARRAEAE